MNANEKRKPTIEHLQPKSLGGGNDLENLRLCHPGCNNALGNRPHANKERMRENFQRGAAKVAATKAAAAPVKPTIAVKVKAAVPAPPAKVTPSRLATPAPGSVVASAPARRMTALEWHRLAFVATAAATFFAGLSLGMLVR